MNSPKLILYMLALILLTSAGCNRLPEEVEEALRLSGNNRSELETVIEKYQSPKDREKLQAAYFLISNMALKSYSPYSQKEEEFIGILKEGNRESIDSLWNSLEQKDNPMPVFDIQVISSEFLIDNIEYAFKAWDKAPWKADYTFEEFCEYVLPYRTDYDIPDKWRGTFYEKYKWVLDSMTMYAKERDFLYASYLINKGFTNDFGWREVFYNFSHTKVLDIAEVKLAVCRQESSFKIAALRSLGIPASDVSGVVKGTSWTIVPDENKTFWGWVDKSPPKKGGMYVDEERFTEYPKIVRSTFKLQPWPFGHLTPLQVPPLLANRYMEDVTAAHSDAANVSVDILYPAPAPTDYIYLCTFDPSTKDWTAVHWSKIRDQKGQFDQMGLGCIYLPAYYINSQYIPAAPPFYLNKNKDTVELNPLKEKGEIKLHRKTELNYWENKYANLMVHDVFEGSNSKDFKKPSLIYKIIQRPSYMETQKSHSQEPFKYVRYLNTQSQFSQERLLETATHLAEISFYDEQDNKIHGRYIFSENLKAENVKNAFDGDIRTNFNSNELCWIGMEFDRPVQIGKIRYLFRNSFNTIEPGDTYELWYWENEWKLVARKQAVEDYLEFEVPENALFWLKNITKGKEETVFFMQEGIQIWG